MSEIRDYRFTVKFMPHLHGHAVLQKYVVHHQTSKNDEYTGYGYVYMTGTPDQYSATYEELSDSGAVKIIGVEDREPTKKETK